MLGAHGRIGSARYNAAATRGLTSASRIAYVPWCRGRAVAVSGIAPGSHQQQQDPGRKSFEDFRRRRLRFGDKPSWPQVAPSPQRQQTGPPINPSLDNPNSTLLYLSERWHRLSNALADGWGKLLYNYFNWRQDTSKDLLLIFMLFSSFVLLGSSMRHWVIDDETEQSGGGFWNDIYQVCKWVFGQEFPPADSSVSQQGFAVVTAMVGLCAFALVLALVEQVVLEGMEANVKRGNRVYETGHHLILGWCVSQRDLEVVRKILQQICVAYQPEGGTKVVVLTQRSKLEMEGIFWRCMPAAKRFGTRLIFRQGSPLVPSDLKLVGAPVAASTVIVSDQSRSAAEADAQAVRCAILLDELDAECTADRDAAFSSTGASIRLEAAASMFSMEEEVTGSQQLDMSLAGRQVVVELKTSNALPLLKYACSNKTIALPTSQLNAQRLAKMVKRPVISIVSQQLFNFENRVSIFVHYYPHLVGHCFGELAYLFPDGIVMGVVDRITGKARMAPASDYVVLGSQALVICRPTSIRSHAYHPIRKPLNMAELLAGTHSPLYGWTQRPGLAAHGTAQLNPAAAANTGGDSAVCDGNSVSQEWLPAMEDWSKAGVSQVEALRRQVEAEEQAAAAAAVAAASKGSVEATKPTHTSSTVCEQNNIVSVRVDTSSQVGVSRLVAASRLVTVSDLVGRSKMGSVSRPVSRLDSAASSRSITPPAMAAWQQRQLQSLSSSTVPSAASTYTAHTSSSSDSATTNNNRNTTAGSDSIDDNGRSTPPGLCTTDWPVLSGVRPLARHAVMGYNGSWPFLGLPGLYKQPRQQCSPAAGASAADVGAAGVRAGRGGSQAANSMLAGQAPAATLMVPSEYLQVDDGPERVLVLGWGAQSLMADLIKELDHGLSALPAGSEVVFVNTHSADETLGAVLQNTTLEYIKVRHVSANPLLRSSLAAKLDMAAFRCALVLCDELWVDPDKDDANGIDSLDEPSVLRLDSLVMVAQLNIRKLLEDSRLPPINIICQKVATEGLTRFEDRHRLPLGISVNLNSFSAKTLAQIAVNPLMLYPVTRLGEDAQLTIKDSSDYAGLQESMSFWQLVARCQELGDVLLGYYAIPEHLDEPLNTVVDPIGMQERCQPRVWNTGNGRLKFIVLRGMHQHHHVCTSGSVDDMELENTHRAHWVTSRAAGSRGRSISRHGSASSSASNSTGASSTASPGSSTSSNNNSLSDA